MANVRKTVVFDIQGNSTSYEAAAEKAAKASKKAETAADKAADAVGKVGSNSMKAAGALDLVSPSAADAARNLGDAADGAEVMLTAAEALGISLGGLGLAVVAVSAVVAAGALIWKGYHAEEEEAERKSASLTSALKTLAPVHDLAASSALDLAHATKQITDEEYAYQTSLASAKSARDQVIAATNEKIKADQKELEGMGKAARTLDGQLVPAAAKLTQQIEENTSVVTAAEQAYSNVETTLRKTRDATLAAKAADKEAKQEILERKAAHESFIEAVHDLIDAENREFKLSQERAKVAKENAKIVAEAEKESADQRAEAEYNLWAREQEIWDARVAMWKKGAQDAKDIANDQAANALDAAAQFVEALGAIADAQLEARTDALSEVQAQIDDLDGLIADLGDTTVNAAELSGQALVEAYKAGEVAASDLSESQQAAVLATLESEKAAAEKEKAIKREAALEAFHVQQATAVSATLIAGLQGAVAAFQLGPIAGAIAAAAIGALTLTNVGLIANEKPSFHAGGVRGGPAFPDEVLSVTLPGEGHATRQAMNDPGNREALNAMNAGHSVGGGVTVLRIGRRESREIARTDIRSNGIIPETIRAIARRSGNGAGLSGRGVLA